MEHLQAALDNIKTSDVAILELIEAVCALSGYEIVDGIIRVKTTRRVKTT